VGILVTAVDSDMRNAGNVFECEWAERGAGSQGWAKPYFPSWEAERIANSDPERFRWSMAILGPENQPGNWEYQVETDGEWLPVEWLEDHGVGKWAMAPQWEWRVVNPPVEVGDDEETLETWAEWVELGRLVHGEQENHCNLTVSDMKFKTVGE